MAYEGGEGGAEILRHGGWCGRRADEAGDEAEGAGQGQAGIRRVKRKAGFRLAGGAAVEMGACVCSGQAGAVRNENEECVGGGRGRGRHTECRGDEIGWGCVFVKR